MFLRRGLYAWLFPAALVLPLWLLLGWGIFTGGGLAFLWVLFIACPSVFLGQLLISFLIRARGTVRAERAVSWWDVLGLTVWHGLTIAVGVFNDAWFAPVLVGAILAGFGMIVLSFWQLWREAKPIAVRYTTVTGPGAPTAPGAGTGPSYQAPRTPSFKPGAGDVFIIEESHTPKS